MQSVLNGHVPPQRAHPGDGEGSVHSMLLQHRQDDAVRQAAASLHAATRKYQQSVQPLLTFRNRELPVKTSTSAFVVRLAEDVAQCALDCVDVLRSEGDVRSATRRKSLCQMLSIAPPDASTPLELLFLRDLKTRMWPKQDPSDDAMRGSSASSQRDDDMPSLAVGAVPVPVVVAVARSLWLHRRCDDAAELLWTEAVEELLGMDSGMHDEDSGAHAALACARSVVRTSVLLAGSDRNTVAPVSVASNHELTRGQRVLVEALELWCVCRGASGVATVLSDETTGALMACALSASVWGPLKRQLQSRADIARPLQQLSSPIGPPPSFQAAAAVAMPTAVSPERLKRRAAFKGASSSTLSPTSSKKPTMHSPAAPLSPTVSTVAAGSPSHSDGSIGMLRGALRWVTEAWLDATSASRRSFVVAAIGLVVVQLIALWYMRAARRGVVGVGTRPTRRALDL